MSSQVPNPGSLGHLHAPRSTPRSTLSSALEGAFPGLSRLCRTLGIDVETDLQEWAHIEGLSIVRDWLDLEAPSAVIAANLQATTPRTESPLNHLVREAHVSARPDQLGPEFKQYRESFVEVLTRVRAEVSSALFRWGQNTGYARQAIMLRALDLSRRYSQDLVYSDRLQGTQPHPALLHRLAAATVISGRFESQPPSEIHEATLALEEAIRADSARSKSRELYLEALVQLFDAEGDPVWLDRATEFIAASPDEGTATWHLNAVDALVRLLDDEMREPQPVLSRVFDHLRHAETGAPEEPVFRARLEMTKALVEHVRVTVALAGRSFSRGVNLPFGARHRLNIDSRLSETWTALIAAIAPLARAGEFLYRDLCADLLSRRARHFGSATSRTTDLQQAIEFRTGSSWQRQLEGERIRLALANDFLLLASMTANPSNRESGLSILLKEALASEESPAALILLARDLQDYGPHLGRPGESLSQDRRIQTHPFEQAIRDGDAARLYSAAANRAIRSQDVRHRDLGGRDGVWVVDEPSGLSGKTLVIKPMQIRRWKADVHRTEEIREALRGRRSGAFGLVEHLGSVPPASDFPEDPSTIIRSVRQFVEGSTLKDFLEANADKAINVLAVTARYLALIGTVGEPDGHAGSARRHLWDRELGRWLRFLTDDNAQARSIFDRWWTLVEHAPLLRKRDAHVQNWIIDTKGRILAVDLDCVGSRPLGYELAQLTDDHPFVHVGDAVGRETIVSNYRAELSLQGLPIDENSFYPLYEAGQFARCIFTLSHVVSTPPQRRHAVQLLTHLRDSARSSRLREIAETTYVAWAIANNVNGRESPRAVPEAERYRLSRAMAFHLRHNPEAPRSSTGWIYVDNLVELLVSSGFKTSSEQVLAVAGALGEARFETNGDRIRARHGHSLPVRVAYEDGKRPTYLFHGTSITNMASIVEARDGLRPMHRQQVHLTEKPTIALHAAARRKEPVILMKLRGDSLERAGRATDDIWVTARVPSSLLQIVPVWEVRDLLEGRTMELN